MSLKPGSKLLATYGWRAEMWWRLVPDNQSSDTEAPSVKLGYSDSRNDQITLHSSNTRMLTSSTADI